MKSKEINRKALDYLAKQEWKKAQDLFFYNAKKYPSHQTYNNLGIYLITEGLTSSNGKVRNAMKLGLKYLLKSSEIKTTVINNTALIAAIEYALRDKKEDKKRLINQALELSESSLKLEYSLPLQYNYLLFSFLVNRKNAELLLPMKDLVRDFTCTESVSLYFGFLSENHLSEEGLKCLADYGELLDDLDKMMFFAKVGLYEKGRDLCKSVLNTYAIDEQIASAVIECFEDMSDSLTKERIEQEVRELLKDSICISKKEATAIMKNLFESKSYRKSKIDEFKICGQMMASCYYFGCPTHGTKWIN